MVTDSLIPSLSYANQTDNQKRKATCSLDTSTILVMKVHALILAKLGLPGSSSADRLELHTVSDTCGYTVTFITVHTNKISVCFVLFISRRYQRLTLYNLEYDCWTTKWTRFVTHEVPISFLSIQGFLSTDW